MIGHGSGACPFAVNDRVRLITGSTSAWATVIRATFFGAVFRTELRVGGKTLLGEVFVPKQEFARRVRVMTVVKEAV